jgi:hypothetical protein
MTNDTLIDLYDHSEGSHPKRTTSIPITFGQFIEVNEWHMNENAIASLVLDLHRFNKARVYDGPFSFTELRVVH